MKKQFKPYHLRLSENGKYYINKVAIKGGNILFTSETYNAKQDAELVVLSDLMSHYKILQARLKPTLADAREVIKDFVNRDMIDHQIEEERIHAAIKKHNEDSVEGSGLGELPMRFPDNVTCPSSATPPIIEPGCSH